ncbi:hypothetical protein DFH94DRAFT_254714 [Russula ochroleuca]|jgi:hypothetical protein|uniref:Uncharacterized protein n=1 Tax=Russula ochroleuca TaxID=152965 RepID=A0A9P5N2W8_9AGAM|nr:hypothetical protein DFH94DRAFT_254714 [Russula ochroleuca]
MLGYVSALLPLTWFSFRSLSDRVDKSVRYKNNSVFDFESYITQGHSALLTRTLHMLLRVRFSFRVIRRERVPVCMHIEMIAPRSVLRYKPKRLLDILRRRDGQRRPFMPRFSTLD